MDTFWKWVTARILPCALFDSSFNFMVYHVWKLIIFQKYNFQSPRQQLERLWWKKMEEDWRSLFTLTMKYQGIQLKIIKPPVHIKASQSPPSHPLHVPVTVTRCPTLQPGQGLIWEAQHPAQAKMFPCLLLPSYSSTMYLPGYRFFYLGVPPPQPGPLEAQKGWDTVTCWLYPLLLSPCLLTSKDSTSLIIQSFFSLPDSNPPLPFATVLLHLLTFCNP